MPNGTAPKGGTISTTVGHQSLEITSTGPVVHLEHLAILGQRFERAGTTTPGSGLGLAIVDSIMRQVGGRLELYSPAVNRDDGFTARILLG